jgi:hypothetical protein
VALFLFISVMCWLVVVIRKANAAPAPPPLRTRKPDPPTEDPGADAKPVPPLPAAKTGKPVSPISELLSKAAAPQPTPTAPKPTPVLNKPVEPFRAAKPAPEPAKAAVAEAKPAEAKPAEAKPAEAQPAVAEAKPADAKPAKAPEPMPPAPAPAPVLFQSESGRKDTDGASLFSGLKDLQPPPAAEAKPAPAPAPGAEKPAEKPAEAKPADKPRTHTAELDDILHRIDKVLADAPPPPAPPPAPAPAPAPTKPDLPAGGGMMMITESGRITNSSEPARRKSADDGDLLRRIDEALALSNGTSAVAGTMVDPDFAAEAADKAKADAALDQAKTVTPASAAEAKPAAPLAPTVPAWARADALDSDLPKDAGKDAGAQQKLF